MEKNKVIKNASWIIGAKLIQAILGLVITMLTARYLGPANYGIINYAASLVAFAAPIMQLGLNAILVQEFVNFPEKEGETLGTALTLCIISSFLTIFGIFAFVMIVNQNETETIIVCVLYSILLVFQALELIQYWYQSKLLSKYVSVTSLVAYALISFYKISLLITGKSVRWFAVSQALDYMVIAFSLIYIYIKMGNQKPVFSFQRAKNMLGKSRYYIISNLMVVIFAQTDRVMLKLMEGDIATGYYSAAVTCAGMTSFVFSAIIDSFRPVIFESKKSNEYQFKKNMIILYSIIIYFSFIQSLGITLFSKYIIHIMYGEAYYPAIPALQIIVWYTTFSYLGSVRNIWILAEDKQKYLWIINLSGAVTNVVLNWFLIPVWGINGASFASLITQIFTNVIIGFVIKPIKETNYLMLLSLNITRIVAEIKKR